MASDFELAKALFGTDERIATKVASASQVVRGWATSDSSSGSVTVVLETDAGGTTAEIDCPTSNAVEDGDEVLVTVSNGSPVECVVAGSGDRVMAAASNAETLATQATAVANATGQHFWEDADGAHVTEVTKDEWNDSGGANYQSGANSLWNSLGMLFRDGLTNLLAILTSGIAIYDGQGNNASNILAEFKANLIRIGGILSGSGTSTATVQFFDSTASSTTITAEHTVGTADPNEIQSPDDVYGINHTIQITTETDDSELDADAEGHTAWAALDLFADVNPDYEAGSAMLKATAGGAYDSSADPTIGVLRQIADNGTEASNAYVSAAQIQLNDTARTVTGYVNVSQAIVALQQPCATYTGNNSTATASATGWQLTYFNNAVVSHGSPSTYFTNSNGIITAVRDCVLEISGAMNWNDKINGQRGFGIFPSGTVGSGTEYSTHTYFNNTTSSANRKTVVFPPQLFALSAGDVLAVGRHQPDSAIYVNGTNFSWLTIKVVGA